MCTRNLCCKVWDMNNANAAATVRLGSKTLSVFATTKHGLTLKGGRGAAYSLVQNIHSPTLWTLIGNGGRVDGRFRGDGMTFEAL